MKRYPSNSRGFRRTALKSHPKNRYVPMRGGIRL